MSRLTLSENKNYLLSASGIQGAPCNSFDSFGNPFSGTWINTGIDTGYCRNIQKKTSLKENYLTLSEAIDDNYISVPNPQTGEILKVREDYFDSLTDTEWNNVMNFLEPFNSTETMNGLFSKWRDRRKAKKDERVQRKISKIDARSKGKLERIQAGGGLSGLVKGVVGAFTGNRDEAPEGVDQYGKSFNVEFGSEDTKPKWYKTPLGIGGIAVGSALVLFAGYKLVTRKK